jgi:aspartate carbamoyltransferase catalytic subunit
VRSLTYLLSKFQDVRLYYVAPPLLHMKADILEHLRERHVEYVEETSLENVLPEVDVVYQTRIQKERFGDRIADYEECRGVYVIDPNSLRLMKPKAIVMHPLPRLDEITMEVDADSRAAYFRQAQNGLYVRMALLTMVLPT